jgi:hypothetical protein
VFDRRFGLPLPAGVRRLHDFRKLCSLFGVQAAPLRLRRPSLPGLAPQSVMSGSEDDVLGIANVLAPIVVPPDHPGLPQWRGEKSTSESSTPCGGRALRSQGPGITSGFLTTPTLLPEPAMFSRRSASRKLFIIRSPCTARSCRSRWTCKTHRTARTTIAATPKNTAPG